jgi:hypothetical protein
MKNLFSQFINFDSVDDLYKAIGILKFNDVHKLRVATYMYKMVQKGMHERLLATLDLRLPDHQYETRYSDEYVLPYPRVEALRMNYIYQFTKIWNSVPTNIKRELTIKAFKRKYSHYLNNVI